MTDEKRTCLMSIKDKLIEQLDDKQFHKFVEQLYTFGYFNNISESDIQWCLSTKYQKYGFSIDTLKYDAIAIGMNIGEEKICIGIDPTRYFDKTTRCSVLAWFPMSKREYKRFIDFFQNINDKKSTIYKAWTNVSKMCWYGSYATFGNRD